MYQLYLSRVITAASKRISSLVFDDFFFANSYFFSFSNIFGSLSITRFYIRTVNCIEALAFTSFISSYSSLHDKGWCLFVSCDITWSVKNIRNHVGTAALPAARRTARRLQRLSPFIVSLEKYFATDVHFFTRPPCLVLPEVLLTLERGLFQMNKIQSHSRIHHTSPETMHLYVYIKRKCLSFLYYFRPIKLFCRTLCFLILQRTRLNWYYCSIKFGYHFLCDIMWCDNLFRDRGRLSQVTCPYKLFINNHSVMFERNPILLNCSRGFTRNFGISQPS